MERRKAHQKEEHGREQTKTRIHGFRNIDLRFGAWCIRRMNAISGCFRSIPKLLQRKDDTTPSPLVPEDVVLEILTRLPAEDILRCRMVCKRWMCLTSTPHFINSHLLTTRATPMILLHHGDPCNHSLWYSLYEHHYESMLHSLDLSPEEPCVRKFDMTKLPLYRRRICFGATCDGLVLLWSVETGDSVDYLSAFIFNPLTGREIADVVAAGGYYFYGFYFHPTRREYLFLTSDRRGYLYKVFNLRGECTVVGLYREIPLCLATNVNGSLYYLLTNVSCPMERSTMVFNIEREKFDFKPHPPNHEVEDSWGLNKDGRFWEMEGSLGFVQLVSSRSYGHSIYIWILADSETWDWTQRYKVGVGTYPRFYNWEALSGIDKGGEMLLYDLRSNKLYAFNVETRGMREIIRGLSNIRHDKKYLNVTSYVSSLVGPESLGPALT